MIYEKTEVLDDLFLVLSEPGDCTSYSYFVYKYFDDFSFMPCINTFRYPQRLNYHNIKNATEEQIIELAQKEFCNPFTLKECIRTIKKIMEE